MICIKLTRKFSLAVPPKQLADWLYDLPPTKRGKDSFRLSVVDSKISFVRYEDAIAFRLRFGV